MLYLFQRLHTTAPNVRERLVKRCPRFLSLPPMEAPTVSYSLQHGFLSRRSRLEVDKPSLLCFHPSISDHVRGCRMCLRVSRIHMHVTLVQQHVCPHTPCTTPKLCQKEELSSVDELCTRMQTSATSARMKHVPAFLVSRAIPASIVLKSGPAGSHEVGKDGHSV